MGLVSRRLRRRSFTATIQWPSTCSPFPAGLLPTWLGATRAVLLGGVIIALGHFTLALHATTTFYAGLVLVALGTGLFKPSISALVGSLYERDDERRDAGFSIFYMGINIGAFLAPLVTGYLAQGAGFKAGLASAGFDPATSWHYGFAAAGIGMAVGLFVFMRQSRDCSTKRSNRCGLRPERLPMMRAMQRRCVIRLPSSAELLCSRRRW